MLNTLDNKNHLPQILNQNIYSNLDNKNYLNSIAKFSDIKTLDSLENLTQGFIYYLLLKHSIKLNPSILKHIALRPTNYFYFYLTFPEQLSVFQSLDIYNLHKHFTNITSFTPSPSNDESYTFINKNRNN